MNKKNLAYLSILSTTIVKNDNFEQTFCTKILRKIFTFFTSHLEKFIILQNMVIIVRIYKKFLLSYKNNAMKNS